LFNLNVGRDIMPGYGLEPQVVMTTALLEGLDGVEKMSKSLGNYVGVTETPGEMFGKLMSISDELMWRYYSLLTELSQSEVERVRADVDAGTLHPKTAKVRLATRIVTDFHSAEAAARAAEDFDARFARGELATDALPEVRVTVPGASIALSRLLVDAGLATSASDASRKVQQGGVKVDRQKVSDPRTRLPVSQGEVVLEAGRRAVRVVLVP
jgi:tyrosyl-tRNA synthetase